MKETKVTKRLVLSKETVKVLTDEQMSKAAGGDILTSICTKYCTYNCTNLCSSYTTPC